MDLVELQRALRQLRCSGMAAALEPRLLEAQTAKLPSSKVSSRLSGSRKPACWTRRASSRSWRRRSSSPMRVERKSMNRRLIFELATGHFVAQHADGLFLGPPGIGKSHLAQAIGFAVGNSHCQCTTFSL